MEAVQHIKGAIDDEKNHTCSDDLLQPPDDTCKFGTGTCRFKQRGGDNRIRLKKYKENTDRPGRHIRQNRRQNRTWQMADAGFRLRDTPSLPPFGTQTEE